jgi:hypothetical protein
LPRRNAEYSVTHLPIFAGSPTDLWTTDYAIGNEGEHDEKNADRTGKSGEESSRDAKSDGNQPDEQARQPGDSTADGNTAAKAGKSGKSDPPGEGDASGGTSSSRAKSNPDGPSQSSGQSQGKGKSDPGQSESGSAEGKGGETKGSAEKGSSAKSPSKKNQGKGQGESQPSSEQQGGRPPQETDKQGESAQSTQESTSQESSSNPQTAERSSTRSPPRRTSRFNPSKLGSAIGGTIGQLLKLVYWVLAGLIVAYVVWRYHREIREALRGFARALGELWQSLFGGRAASPVEEVASEVSPGPPPRPFSSFPDPFASGMAQQRPPAEIVRYSFEAFEAWARERGFPREPEQTPHEFAQLVGRRQSALARDVAVLAELYSRCAYGREPASRTQVESLRKLWTQLQGMVA